MSEYFRDSPEFDNENPGFDELISLPHEKLATYALEKQTEVLRVRGLLRSMARLQQDRELRHESEIIELELSAEKDPLTGLLNKRGWLTRLESMISDGEKDFGVMFIDLSRFKLVNDTYDHIRGDDLLTKTANVIESSLRQEADTIAHETGRYGGDEFAILCDLKPRETSEIHSLKRIQIITNRLQEKFTALIADEGLEQLNIDAAIGFALYEEGMTAEDLLRKADKAMYADKYARTINLTQEETVRLKSVKPILDKAGVRLPEGILEER